MQALLELDLTPQMIHLEFVDESNWRSREEFWIRHYRARFPDLLNCNDFGSGRSSSVMTEAHKEAIRQSLIGLRAGIPQTEEHKQKRSEALKGKPTTEEHRRLTSEKTQKYFDSLSPEEREVLAGKIREGVAKQKGVSKGPASEETKLKMSEALKGKKRSDESKKKYSEARKKWWASAEGLAEIERRRQLREQGKSPVTDVNN